MMTAVVEGFTRSLKFDSLIGGAASIDLADLAFGGTGAFGDISISILDSQKIYDFYDECYEGCFLFLELVGTVTSS